MSTTGLIYRSVLLIAILFAAGCGRQPSGPSAIKPPDKAPAPKIEQKQSVKRLLYLPVERDGKVMFEAKTLQIQPGTGEKLVVMQRLISSRIGGFALLPEKTKVNSFKTDKNGEAVIDLSGEARSFNGGNDDEAGVVNAIVLTAAQFPNVKSVRITCDGAELETLGGHSDLTVPQTPDYSMVVGKK